MINTSDSYKAAVVAGYRRVRIRVPLRIVSPDLQYGAVTATSSAPVSRLDEIHDDEMELSDRYASLEPGRWVLDGTMDILEDDYSFPGQVGYVSDEICMEDGVFLTPQVITMGISGVDILQVVTVVFPDSELDGVADTFTVEVLQAGTAYHTETFTGNTQSKVVSQGFTVYQPDQIRLTINKWSRPHRRARVAEIYPGYSETWTERNLAALSIKNQASINAMAAPYGTASMTIDNLDKLFDPRNKSGLFLSLEERQAVPTYLGLDLDDGNTEWVPTGVYFQQNNGWTMTDGRMTMRWDLIDIIGLLTNREFIAPATLPTTLGGWAAALVTQLGESFASRYTVDPNYSGLSVSTTGDKIAGKNCGDILRWLCQATGTFARADAETGNLTIEPTWNQGNEYTLDNLSALPATAANDNLASIIFKLDTDTDFVVSGNTSNSANTVTVDNPFISTQAQALTAARHILSAYGGNKITTTGRGDPSSEVGDVATVQLDRSNATTARITSQTFEFSGRILRDCKTELLQANGVFLYTDREEITESGTWTAPAGVTQLDVVLVGGGQAGGHGGYGTMPGIGTSTGTSYGKTGSAGESGAGGKVWHATININDGQVFQVHIGAGGAAVTENSGSASPVDGEATTFGVYSSANGSTYTPSWTDIASGNAYGRSGVGKPLKGTGDGGVGGKGGTPGSEIKEKPTDEFGNPLPGVIITGGTSPGPGSAGSDGGSGCVIVYWNKEGSA